MSEPVTNLDVATVEGFGEEWQRFDQRDLSEAEAGLLFEKYFHVFPWERLPPAAAGFDLGCGSGRWAMHVADRGYAVHLVDASPVALAVARQNLAGRPHCHFHLGSVDRLPFEDGSMDFGYSLGVLHHVPDTAAGIRDCVRKLKRGAPFLVYLYYRFDNRPAWFRALWRGSDLIRRAVSRLPHAWRHRVCDAIALAVYWPLARTSRSLERLGANVSAFPLSTYRHLSFYTMRTDALDRFGTQLEQRFTAPEIVRMLEAAGCGDIRVSDREPYWCVVGIRQ
jgi:SAM-dependent methyltransferase